MKRERKRKISITSLGAERICPSCLGLQMVLAPLQRSSQIKNCQIANSRLWRCAFPLPRSAFPGPARLEWGLKAPLKAQGPLNQQQPNSSGRNRDQNASPGRYSPAQMWGTNPNTPRCSEPSFAIPKLHLRFPGVPRPRGDGRVQDSGAKMEFS